MSISNFDDLIDSRDVIDRIEELESELNEIELKQKSLDDFSEEWKSLEQARWLWHEYNDVEYLLLKTLAEEGEQCSDDWLYGSTLIKYDYFETYMDEMIEDCYSDIYKDVPHFMTIQLDFEMLKQDYTELEFNGIIYYIR